MPRTALTALPLRNQNSVSDIAAANATAGNADDDADATIAIRTAAQPASWSAGRSNRLTRLSRPRLSDIP